MDQARVLVHTRLHFHAIGEAFQAALLRMVAPLDLMHLWLPLADFSFVELGPAP